MKSNLLARFVRELGRYLICFLALALVLGCSQACSVRLKNSSHEVDFSDIKLERYQFAFYASPDWTRKTFLSRGLTIFITRNGDYAIHKHDILDSGKLSWTKDGIFYADQKYDYWLSDRGKNYKIYSRKPNTQDGIATLEDSGTRVGVYNGGYTHGGKDYNEQVVISNKGRSRRLRFHNQYGMVIACRNRAYGITSDIGSNGFGFSRLDNLAEDQKFVFSHVKQWEDPLGDEGGVSDGSCRNNTFVYLGMHTAVEGLAIKKNAVTKRLLAAQQAHKEGGRFTETVEVINIRTGKRESIPLINPDGSYFTSPREGFDYSKQVQNSLIGSTLYWLHGDSRILKTDTRTGITRVINKTFYNQRIDFTDHTCRIAIIGHTMVITRGVPDGDLILYFINLKTGKEMKRIRVKGVCNQLPNNTFISDFAVRPGRLLK